jgi:hypothetical protein
VRGIILEQYLRQQDPVYASFTVGVSSDFVMNRDSLIEDSPVEIIFEEIEAQVISSTISFVKKESTDI